MKQLPPAFARLAAYRQFILYHLVEREGKRAKLPIDYRTAQVGNAHDPAIWMPASLALEMCQLFGEGFGVGFVFTEHDPFFFLDIDDCLLPDGSGWSPLALDLCGRFAGAAVEISQSGKGLHIIGTGHVPAHACKNVAHGLELYTSGRFVALTGTGAMGSAAFDCSAALPALVAEYFPPRVEAGAPVGWTTAPVPEWSGPEDDDELIRRALAQHSAGGVFGGRATFRDVWEGNVDALARAYPDSSGARPYDASSADAALAQHLAFWTGKNCERMRRIMQRSALVRDKWNREDYLSRTITRACAMCATVHGTKTAEPVPESPDGVTYRNGYQLLTPTQQIEYFAGCVYVQSEHKVLTPDGSLLDPSRFNAMYGGYDFMINHNGKTTRKAFEALTESQAVRFPKVNGTIFRPDLEPGKIIERDGQRFVNSYVHAQGKAIPGGVGPFLNHLAKLLPNEKDREIFLSYMAACVQYKGVKFQWAPLLQGVEGNGKTLFSRCVAEAIGMRYVHAPRADRISGEFNSWIKDKIFIYVEDVYFPDGKREIIETLKPIITNDWQSVEPKGVDQVTTYVVANFMLNSNHKDAIRKTHNDRRFAPFFTAQQEVEDLARDGMTGDYFARLYGWLESGGFAHVAHYLATRSINVDVMGRAPATSSTAEAVRSSLGVAEQLVQEAIDLEERGFRGGLVCTKAAAELLKLKGKYLSPQRVAGVLSNLGYVKHPALSASDGKITVGVDDRRRIYVKRDSLAAQLQTPDAVAEAWRRVHGGGPVQLNGIVRSQSVFSDRLKGP